MYIQQNHPSHLVSVKLHDTIHVIARKEGKIFRACQAEPKLAERIQHLASTGLKIQGVQSLPYIAVDRLRFSYTFIIPITGQEFLLTMDERKLVIHLATLLSGSSKSSIHSLIHGRWKMIADNTPTFDNHQHIKSRRTGCSIDFRRQKRSILATRRFPAPFQDVTGDDFDRELPVQLHLPEQTDFKAYHAITIERQEGTGKVFLCYTAYFSGNPQRALKQHPFLSDAILSPEEYVQCFFQKNNSKEIDNYLDDDQTCQQSILNALTNTMQSFLALHYAELRRAIHQVDNLMDAVDMPENWMECPCDAHLTKVEIDWHFRVQSAPWFVHQLGLNIRPEIRDDSPRFRHFEENECVDKMTNSKLRSWDELPNGFVGHPTKGIEISAYIKTPTLPRLEVRMSYNEGLNSGDDSDGISDLSSSVHADSYQGLLNKILQTILIASRRVTKYLHKTNEGYEYVDLKYATEQGHQWLQQFVQFSIEKDKLLECLEIVTCVQAGYVPTSLILKPATLAYISLSDILGKSKKSKIPAFFKQKGSKDQGILRFYPVIPEQ